jgi:hypothetical protein
MSKAKVISLAKKLNCEIVIERDYIEVVAPKGKLIGDYQHYSGYGTDSYRKSEIWRNLIDDLSEVRDCQGTEYCDCAVVK